MYKHASQVQSADSRSSAMRYPSAHACLLWIGGYGARAHSRQRLFCRPSRRHTRLKVGPAACTGALTELPPAGDPDGALDRRLGQSPSSGPTRGLRALHRRRRRRSCPAVPLDRLRWIFSNERCPGRLSCGRNARRGAECAAGDARATMGDGRYQVLTGRGALLSALTP